MDYKKILRSLVLGLGMVLVVGGVAYAATTISGTLTLSGTRRIDFNVGGSMIYDDANLRVVTDDALYLDALTVVVGKAGYVTRTLDFNQGGSKIYEDANLRIATDDNIYLIAPGTVDVSNDMDVAGDLTVAGTVSGTMAATGTTETTFTFGSGSDADATNMVLNLGGTNPAILAWAFGTHTLSFTDNLAITGTLGVTGATTLSSTLATGGNATFAEDVALGDAANDTITILGDTTITDATVDTDGNALTVNGLLTGGTSERGIAAEFVSQIRSDVSIGAATGMSTFLFVDDDNVELIEGSSIRGLYVGVEEDHPRGVSGSVNADLSGGYAYGITIYMEFGTANPPQKIYPLFINGYYGANPGISALIGAANPTAIGLVEDDATGLATAADAYVTIEVFNYGTYRIPLYKVP